MKKLKLKDLSNKSNLHKQIITYAMFTAMIEANDIYPCVIIQSVYDKKNINKDEYIEFHNYIDRRFKELFKKRIYSYSRKLLIK